MTLALGKRSQRGFSLFELLIAAVVLTIAVVPLLVAIAKVYSRINVSAKRTTLTRLAENKLEEMKALKWDENMTDPATYITNATAVGSLGPDSGEATENDFDDVDDYDNFTDTPATDITRSIIVQYVDVPLNGTVTVSASTTDYKMATVTVTYQGQSVITEKADTVFVNGPG